MSTLNGLGTLYYDWQSNGDGTANATRWFVVFFLPVVPLKRERLRVIKTEKTKSGVLDFLLALTGHGSGFETQFEIVGEAPNSIARILKTYVLAYICLPLITFILPVILMVALTFALGALGVDPQRVFNFTGPIFGILLCLWIGVVVASILDRSAGRKHASPMRSTQR